MGTIFYEKQTERWGIQEVTIKGTEEGNPFVEQAVWGTFCGPAETVTVKGFYDGEGMSIW